MRFLHALISLKDVHFALRLILKENNFEGKKAI